MKPHLSAYWEFCVKFLGYKYGADWCLSLDHSLAIHAGNWSVPPQLIVRSPQGNNRSISFLYNTSLFSRKADLPPNDQLTNERGIRMYNLQSSLIYSSAAVFNGSGLDARTAFSMIRDASEVLPILLENGHTTIGGRLAGAFRNIGRSNIADQIMETMKQAGYDIREDDPFQNELTIALSHRERSSFVNRIRLMWSHMRDLVIKEFPSAPGIPTDHERYLKNVDDVYITDAYHSLYIERYRVTPELIERVSSGQWDTKNNEEDKKQRDAMAARGYYHAFQEVKSTINQVLNGENAGLQSDKDHQRWYRELFAPSVSSGILKASDLAGYRNHQVYIGNSKHVPLSVDAMRDTMPILFELLENESEASVRAVLGHFVFVFIHPYMDGNGRMGRFLMNAMLASGGYPRTVIPLERRDEYMKALEQASVGQDIGGFVKLISYLVREAMKGSPVATLPSNE